MCDVKITLTDKTPESSTLNEDLNALNKDENKDEVSILDEWTPDAAEIEKETKEAMKA